MSTPIIHRRNFPEGFIFGSATSAYQIEGASSTGGRGPSVWDTFTHRYPGKIEDGKNGNVAIDAYNRVKGDVQIIKKIGLDAYRFSISWPRLLPSGKLSGGVNREGIDYYNSLIDELLENGIEPHATLFHWDLPQMLEDDYQGFLDRTVLKNETVYGKNIVLMDPVTFGDYPSTMQAYVKNRLPKFTDEQKALLKGSYDFLGLNYYTANYATLLDSNPPTPSYDSDSKVQLLANDLDGNPIGETPGTSWLLVYPEGIYKLLKYIKDTYNDPVIYIHENGANELDKPEITLPTATNDQFRIDYFSKHLCQIKDAIYDGVKVRGYFAWSLMDNFEWASGYTVRFGMVYVDYNKELARHPKDSAKWFKKFLQKEDSAPTRKRALSFTPESQAKLLKR